MSWEDQGRQEHGEFGSGAAPSHPPVDLDGRIRGMGQSAVAALPRELSGHRAATFSDRALGQLSEAMRAWVGGLNLPEGEFAERFFHREAGDPVVANLRAAAEIAAAAKSPAELRDGTEHLAAAVLRSHI